MKTILRLTATAAAFALSCHASEPTPQIDQAYMSRSYTQSNGTTYVARVYDEALKKIAITKINPDNSQEIDCGYGTFELLYSQATKRMVAVLVHFVAYNFSVENEEELNLVKNIAANIAEECKCYFRPPYLDIQPGNVVRMVQF